MFIPPFPFLFKGPVSEETKKSLDRLIFWTGVMLWIAGAMVLVLLSDLVYQLFFYKP